MIKVVQKGDFKKTENFLRSAQEFKMDRILRKYGEMGVDALSKATPRDTGKTADSWIYEIEKRRDGFELSWHNTNQSKGIPIVILLQYGHVSRDGSYVKGQDFINPAIAPILDKLAEEGFVEVTK